METSVTKKGQTNIPAAIRKRHHIQEVTGWSGLTMARSSGSSRFRRTL